MELLYSIVVIIGLFIFESIASIYNAIINADILATMKEKARRWFLVWGILLSVFFSSAVFAVADFVGRKSVSWTDWCSYSNFYRR